MENWFMISRVLRYCYELSRNQWLKPGELRKLQEKRLRAIVRHAYGKAQLYHSKLNSVGLKPEDIRTIEDLKKIPFVTKQEVRDGIPGRSIAKGYGLENCVQASTSGTSGGPMPVFYDRRFLDYSVANWYFRKIVAIGLSPLDKMVSIEYGTPEPSDVNREKTMMSRGAKPKSMGRVALGPAASMLSRLRKRIRITDNAEEVLAEIVKFQPKLIDGNTSYLRVVAETIIDKGVKEVHPKAVRGDGEVLDGPTRKFLENVFECDVFDEYSAWDFGHGAWECVRREGYHIDADLLIMEIIRDGEPAAPGEQGEIVVTGLLNYAMPLIRYKVGDVGILGEDVCSCGRGLPILKSVEGRMVDCFRLSNGRIVTPKTIMTTIQDCPGVSRYQAVQEGTNKVTIELMRRKDDPEVSVEELVARCRGILGDDVKIEVFKGDRKNLKAKFRPVVSKLTVSGETRWTRARSNKPV
ncbi:MAG: hypothetical protein QXI42_04120 [Thermoproteota archaeon]